VRPIVLTVEASRGQLFGETARHRHAASAAEVVIAGDHEVDLMTGLDELARLGYRDVLVEGGPSINAELAALELIDELCLTVSPLVLGGASSRIVQGEVAAEGQPVELASIVTADGFLFLRYRRGTPKH
jgi:riboflavin biosynthesis pyrimidine reductase